MSEQRPVIEGTVVERLVNARRQPVVPAWIRDDVTRRAAAKFAAIHAGHVTAFHAVRSPKYLARTLVHVPRGVVRTVGGLGYWLLDMEAQPLHSALIAAGDRKGYESMDKIRARRIRNRLTGTGVTVAVAGAGLAVACALWPPAWIPAAALAVGVLGYRGRPLDRVWLDVPVVDGGEVTQPLTGEVIIRALTSLGIAAMKPEQISFIAPGVHKDGPGWRADIDLPYGVTATDVIDRRERLSAALRRPLGCVWPEIDREAHEARLVLWVGYQPMSKTRQPAWPLGRDGAGDLFRPVPFAVDQRGRVVAITLMFAGVLIGAMPRMGKTMALRILLLAAALDPLAEIHAWELKGTGDLSFAEKVAHRYGSGADDVTLAECLDSVRYVHAELDKRAAVIRGLPKNLCPENKVTPELARKRSLGLHPLVLAISECQEAFSDPKLGQEFDDKCTAITKRGPALGIIPLFDTQRPDAKSLPTGISSNIALRFCLKVMGQMENDMVLGTSSYKNGYRATTFSLTDKGIGWLKGEGDEPQIVRTFYIDQQAAEKIADRARRARAAAGLLAGYAAGEAPEIVRVSLLEDVAFVMGGEERVWNEVICERLGELRPEMYASWDAAQLGRALAPLGIASAQKWGSDALGLGRNRQGIALKDVLTAVERGRART